MPRRPRLIMPDVPLHIIQRGNNRQPCFYADEDYLFYLEWLHEYSRTARCAIHAYVLMTNHVHLLITPANAASAGELMKWLGQRYVQYVNRTYQRSGTLWEGRFRSCLAEEDGYLLACQRYIEMNPVRASMVSNPDAYRWSSYQANAWGKSSPILTPHPQYLALSDDPGERQHATVNSFVMKWIRASSMPSARPPTAILRWVRIDLPSRSVMHWADALPEAHQVAHERLRPLSSSTFKGP